MGELLRILPVVIIGISAVVMYGCEERLGAEPVGDEEALRGLVDELTDWFAVDGHLGDESEDPPTKGEIAVRTWWREVRRPIPRRITIDVVGDSALAIVEADIHGWFTILVDADPDSIIRKELADSSVRFAVFKRDTASTYHRGWRLHALSGVEVTSDTQTVRIDSVRVQLVHAGSDMLVVDPLALFQRDEMITLPPDSRVEVTTYTNDSTGCVYLHTFRPMRPHRWRFRHRGDGVYHGVWFTPGRPGIYHAAVDIIQHETIHDDEYPYDSNAWLLPYRVIRGE
jgi:hypothetical protein